MATIDSLVTRIGRRLRRGIASGTSLHTETIDELVARLSAIASNQQDTRIYIRGDRNLPYGAIMAVMGRINSAGYRRVALITEAPANAR